MIVVLVAMVAGAFALLSGFELQEISSTELKEQLQLLQSDDSAERMSAILRLSQCPSVAETTAKPLSHKLFDNASEVKLAAQRAFERLGASAVPPLLPLLESEDRKEYLRACEAIYFIGPPAEKAVPKLVERLRRDPSSENKSPGPEVPPGDPNFRQDSRQKAGDWVRIAAAHALSAIGKPAASHLDQLIEALDDSSFHVQMKICQTLEKIGPAAAPAEDRLIELAKNGNGSIKGTAFAALGAIGDAAKNDTEQILINGLNEFLVPVRDRALIGLAHYGTKATRAVEPVRKLADDPEKSNLAQAAFTLWKITGDPGEGVGRLVPLTANNDYRISAINFLGKMGPDAIEAVDTLVELTSDSDASIREGSIQALQAISPRDSGFRSRLSEMIESEDDALVADLAQLYLNGGR